MHKDKYANICKLKYAKTCKKYAKVMQWPRKNVLAFICIYMQYTFICKVCKHEIHMQNMKKYAPPTLI